MIEPILVSAHLPKTAGTSFAAALQSHFGERYRGDYADLPMQISPPRRKWKALSAGARMRAESTNGVACVHGHFLPLKYRIGLRGREARFVTWLRDPVERVISHYHYWLRDYDGDDPTQPLRNRVLREGWSLQRFCLGPELRNLYRQYLWGFPAERFDFIGITERYDDDLALFGQRYLGGDAVVARALANPQRDDQPYPIDPALRARIARHHDADVRLYAWAKARNQVGAAPRRPAGQAEAS